MPKSIIHILAVAFLVILGISTRFIFLIDGESILPNFSAIGAVAIFGACYFKGLKRWIIPLSILWLSDIILNNVFYSQYYDGFKIFGDFWVYASFVVAGLLAYKMMNRPSWSKLLLTGITAGVVFYIITNFGVWMTGSLYPKTMAGLLASYEAGIPFFRNTILGNVFYSFVLVGIYEFIIVPYLSLGEYRKLTSA